VSENTSPAREALGVLLAERDPSIRAQFERLGEQAGWRCATVSDAAGMLSKLERESFDIVITDLVAPEMSSADLLKRLRGASEGDAGRRVIVLAAKERLGSADTWIRAGASDVVMAPVNVEAVRLAIERIATVFTQSEQGEDDSAYKFVSAERGTWELTSRELATIKFPLYIVERLYRAGRVDKTEKLRLELAFQEALLNALDHGNLELDSVWREEFDDRGIDRYSRERALRLADPRFGTRKVFIETILERSCLTIRIRDEGKGFNPPVDIATPTQPLCSGRGLAIIKGSVDEVHFAHDGTEITLIKFLPS
jgi:DNA-binding response OmpR family regulator